MLITQNCDVRHIGWNRKANRIFAYQTTRAARSYPYTAALWEGLEWRRLAFIEYDVEADLKAFPRLLTLTAGGRSVPVLVEDGQVK